MTDFIINYLNFDIIGFSTQLNILKSMMSRNLISTIAIYLVGFFDQYCAATCPKPVI